MTQWFSFNTLGDFKNAQLENAHISYIQMNGFFYNFTSLMSYPLYSKGTILIKFKLKILQGTLNDHNSQKKTRI